MVLFINLNFDPQDPKEWPIIEPLPSYGRGRERLGGRHISLIHGNGISNAVITGNIKAFSFPSIHLVQQQINP